MSESADRDFVPIVNMLSQLIDGYQASALIYAAVKLGLPDKMDSGAWSTGRLAESLDLPVPTLSRFLRALAAIGVCDELPQETFVLNQAGQELRSTSTSGLRERAILALEQYWPAWSALDRSIRLEPRRNVQYLAGQRDPNGG
jgi:hypothetical protein